jgi:PAS domain S-box-containing protein
MKFPDFSRIICWLPEPMLLVEAAGTVVAANPRASRLFRLAAAELVGKPLAAFLSDDPKKLKRYLSLCSRNPEGSRGGLTIHPPNKQPFFCRTLGGLVPRRVGQRRLVWLHLRPLACANKRSAVYPGRVKGLTPANLPFHRNEQRWRAAFENSAIGIIMADFRGRYFAANSCFLNMLGYSESELYERSFIDVTYENDREANLNLVRELVEGTRRHFEIEKRYRRKDGSLVWVRNSVALVPGVDAVEPFWFAIVEDITQRKRVEEELRLQIKVLQNIPAAAWTVTPDGRCDFVNQFFLDATGMSREYIQSAPDEWKNNDNSLPPLFSGLPPQERERAASLFWNGIRTGEGWAFEAQHFHASDQSYHWHFNRAAALRDSQGNIFRFVGTSTDIEPLKQAQESLRESETRLQAFFEHSPNLIFLKDRKGRYLHVNKEFKRAFAITEEEIQGKTDDEIFSLEQAAAFQANDRQVLDARAAMEFEEVACQEDGQHTSIVHKFPLFNTEGIIYAIGGIATDITEREKEESARRLAEDKLRASERSLRELTETIPQMLWSADADGRIDYCNRRVLDYTGLTAEQVRGAGWMKAVHQDDVEGMGQAWLAAVSAGNAFQCEVRCFQATIRDYRWCISSALPLRDQDGHIIKWFGTVVDLHDWKEAQQALQTAQAELARVSRLTTMGELAASIAHEVNQPLTAITNNSSGCLRLLVDGNPGPKVLCRALEEIVADSTRASAVIGRIRAFMKKTPTERIQLDVNELIQEVLALTDRDFSENQILLERKLAKTPPLVLGDRIQLQQVLLNLIMNGIEAMTAVRDRPRLLQVQSNADESGDLVVAVGDSGLGLGLEADRVFAPFFTTKENGIGMGLSISRSLVEDHGGRLWATPNLPYGALFRFTLPAAHRNPS